jgi:hypothetical protein
VLLRPRNHDARRGGSRFLEVHPVEGGSGNDYDYVEGVPVNNLDLDGTFGIAGTIHYTGADGKRHKKCRGRDVAKVAATTGLRIGLRAAVGAADMALCGPGCALAGAAVGGALGGAVHYGICGNGVASCQSRRDWGRPWSRSTTHDPEEVPEVVRVLLGEVALRTALGR